MKNTKGLGALSDSEREALIGMIADTGSLYKGGERALETLDQFESTVNRGAKSKLDVMVEGSSATGGAAGRAVDSD
jgi:hypothetical protein